MIGLAGGNIRDNFDMFSVTDFMKEFEYQTVVSWESKLCLKFRTKSDQNRNILLFAPSHRQSKRLYEAEVF